MNRAATVGTTLHVIEHIGDDVGALQPGGRLLVAVPAFMFLLALARRP
jgi:hypothetical protein